MRGYFSACKHFFFLVFPNLSTFMPPLYFSLPIYCVFTFVLFFYRYSIASNLFTLAISKSRSFVSFVNYGFDFFFLLSNPLFSIQKSSMICARCDKIVMFNGNKYIRNDCYVFFRLFVMVDVKKKV